MQNFTSSDLLLYLFNEVPTETTIAIEKAIYSNSQLQEEYQFLQETISDIENFSISPNDRVMEIVLSKLLHEKDAHTV